MESVPTTQLLPDVPVCNCYIPGLRFLPIFALCFSLALAVATAIASPSIAASVMACGVVGGCALCCALSHGQHYLCRLSNVTPRWTFHRVRYVQFDTVPLTFVALQTAASLAADGWVLPLCMYHHVTAHILRGTFIETVVDVLLLRPHVVGEMTCDGWFWAGGAITSVGGLLLLCFGPCVFTAVMTLRHGPSVPATGTGTAVVLATVVAMFLAPLCLWRMLSVCACSNGVLVTCSDVACGSPTHVVISVAAVLGALLLLLLWVHLSITVHPIAPMHPFDGAAVVESLSSPRSHPRLDALAQCLWLFSRVLVISVSAAAPTFPWSLAVYAVADASLVCFGASRGSYFSNVRIINELVVRVLVLKLQGLVGAAVCLLLSLALSNSILQWVVLGAIMWQAATVLVAVGLRLLSASRRSRQCETTNLTDISLEL